MKKWIIASAAAMVFSATAFANSASQEQEPARNEIQLEQREAEGAASPEIMEKNEITSRDVLFAKQRLSELGYYKGKLSVIDVKEPQFIQAVQSFQKDNLLPPTGVLDQKTLQALTLKTSLDSDLKTQPDQNLKAELPKE